MKISTVGIVGCGMMGSGIAQEAVEAGYTTVIFDTSKDAAERTRERIAELLSQGRRHKKKKTPNLETIFAKLSIASSLESFKNCDVVIESIVEDMVEKKKLLTKLDELCSPETILASNTSALSVTEMAKATQRPDRVAGFHFHLPVTRIDLVDLIPTQFTSQETIQALQELGKSLGKEVVIAKDTPGFIVNRLLVPYIIEAIRFFDQGIADRDSIDVSMKLAANHAMGPLLLADYIGLDTLYSVSQTLYKELGEARLAPPQLLKDMVQAGHYGAKSGRGFYNYTEPSGKSDRRAMLMIEMARIFT